MSTAPPRVLVRASDRGQPDEATHPWNPAALARGHMLARAAGLSRLGVNLLWLDPGKEAFAYHSHHREEEWLYVLEGTGTALVDGTEHAIAAGDFLGFPGGVAHLTRNTGAGPLTYLCGGEAIDDADVADFPLLGRRLAITRNGPFAYALGTEVPFITVPPRPPGPRPRVMVRATERGAPLAFAHPQNPRSSVRLTALSRPAGLSRVAVVLTEVEAGKDAYAYHVHQHDEEWMYVLSGTGTVEVGDASHEVGPGDFLGFPPRGPAHDTHASAAAPLVYLAGGDAWTRGSIEIVDFPRLGLRRTMVGTRAAMTFPISAALEAAKTP